MNRRSIAAAVVVVASMIAIVTVGRDTEATTPPVFSQPAGTWMPAIADTGALTGSWFCPGVPATGEDGVGGEVVVSNRDSERIGGRFTVIGPDGAEVEQIFEVEAFAQTTIDVDAFITASFASVVVEIDAGRGFVEQIAHHPAGDAVSPCAGDTSSEWYFADGFTAEGSTETLVLTNPYDDFVLADLTFATENGSFVPSAFQNYTIPARSVRTIQLADLTRDEPVIATSIVARRGRLIAGRAQHYVGGGRLGYDMSLAAPAARDQWWFAEGERAEGVTETFSIYNPTDAAVDVNPYFLGLPANFDGGNFAPINVPARQVVVFEPFEGSAADEPEREFFGEQVPDGRHAVVFSTLSEEALVVVERVLTRPTVDAEGQPTGSVATSVLLGAPPRRDGFVANRWHVGISPDEPTEDALVVYNVDNEQATVTISAVGPGGPSPIPSLTDIPLGPGAVITIDLVAEDALGQELIIDTSNRVFIERSLKSGNGRSASWALPASD